VCNALKKRDNEGLEPVKSTLLKDLAWKVFEPRNRVTKEREGLEDLYPREENQSTPCLLGEKKKRIDRKKRISIMGKGDGHKALKRKSGTRP